MEEIEVDEPNQLKDLLDFISITCPKCGGDYTNPANEAGRNILVCRADDCRHVWSLTDEM